MRISATGTSGMVASTDQPRRFCQPRIRIGPFAHEKRRTPAVAAKAVSCSGKQIRVCAPPPPSVKLRFSSSAPPEQHA